MTATAIIKECVTLIDLPKFYAYQASGFTFRKVLFALYLCVAAVYFGWRITLFNTGAPIFSTLVLIAELSILILALMSVVTLWRVKRREEKPAPEGLKVDVFVPTYNEALPLVRRTLIAAMHINYPHETFLLDDGNRPQMRELADSLGCHYLARETNRGAKPGNLNDALPHAKGDYIAVIDCDHIAQRDYLDRLLGHFEDPTIAFVQAPQDYYNTNAFQFRNDARRGLLWHDQSGFFATGQAGRDYHDATTCCGTSTIVRRKVIDEIGGFPEETVTEDIHVAIKAQKRGYRSAYYPLPLAYGVAPVDLGEFQKQRLRWGQGNVQSVAEEHLPFTTRLTGPQNVCYTILAFLYAEGWSRLILYFTPAFIIFTGLMPIAPTQTYLWFLLPYLFVSVLFFEELGRGFQRTFTNEQMAMARFPVFIASTFAVFRKRIKWVVSSKEFIGHFQPFLLAPQLAVLLANVAAIVWSVSFPDDRLIRDYTIGMWLFGLFWCAFNAVLAGLVVANAVRCARNKRADYRFDLALPVSLSVDDADPVTGETVRLSATGMSFRLPDGAHVGADARLTGHLHLPGIAVPFRASVETDNPNAGRSERDGCTNWCTFDWASQEDYDRVDLSLHACVWHRRLTWDGAHFLTPIERCLGWLGRRTYPQGDMTRHHSALVQFGPAKSGQGPGELALILPGETPDTRTLVTFRELKPRTVVRVLWMPDGAGDVQKLKVGQRSGDPLVASAGPNDAQMHTYACKVA